MKILSIDLPWSSEGGAFGFAWIDLEVSARSVATEAIPSAASEASAVFTALAARAGRFDLVLLDQPIGGAGALATGCRRVERAFGNSSFVSNGAKSIQAPRFQPGAPHAANGLINARAAAAALTSDLGVVVESFPQLSVAALLEFGSRTGHTVGAVASLKTHKSGSGAELAAGQLLGAFSGWTGLEVTGAASAGQPDALDALLALLPAIELIAPRQGENAAPCWLMAAPLGNPPLPSEVPKSGRKAARAAWMCPLRPGQLGGPGIRVDGLLSPRLPGWPEPAGPYREL